MRIIDTAALTEKVALNPDDASWIYNGLDCAVTYEIRDVLLKQLADSPPNVIETYRNTLNKQAPVMEMSMRGIRMDEPKRLQSIRSFELDLRTLQESWDRIILEVFEQSINWRSPTQLKHLFYDIMNLKPVRSRNAAGDYTPTMNRAALEKLSENYLAKPLCNFVLSMRDVGKSISFLQSEFDQDGAMRCSYNLAGTNTGRLASRMNDFGTGTNLQNVARKLRFPFIPRKRKILVNVDLEQADARNVAARIHNIFWDTHGATASAYLDACESGDLHTTVCRMAFTQLPWPDDRAQWRALADQEAYRGLSYRDMSKKLGHGTNYYGQPKTMAGHTKTDVRVIEDFQRAYFAAFPLIPEWHLWVKDQLESEGYLNNLFGRRRFFFNRIGEPATLREAIAYDPQSSTAEEIDRAYQLLWREFPQCDLLAQVHDSILFEMDYDLVNTQLPIILPRLRAPLILKGDRPFYVPLEAKTGWNWGDWDESNPWGLLKFKGSEKREPPYQRTAKINVMDR